MAILDEIASYARLCIGDTRISEYEDYISCKPHKWACQRLLDDIEWAKKVDCPYYWDEGEAGKIVEWFSMLRHSKGVLAGQAISLTLWQKFRLCQLYGWRRKADKRRRFRKTFTQVARKNAKSQEEAGIGLYEISVTAARNKEIAEGYTAGTKRDQSKIVFNEAGLMLKRLSPADKVPLHARPDQASALRILYQAALEGGWQNRGWNQSGLSLP